MITIHGYYKNINGVLKRPRIYKEKNYTIIQLYSK